MITVSSVLFLVIHVVLAEDMFIIAAESVTQDAKLMHGAVMPSKFNDPRRRPLSPTHGHFSRRDPPVDHEPARHRRRGLPASTRHGRW